MPFKEDSKRIVVYLRGGKGQVGRVRAARLMQFANENTLVVGPYYRGSNGSEGRDEFANADLKDVTYLIKILKQRFPNAYIHMIGFQEVEYKDYLHIKITQSIVTSSGWCIKYALDV